MKRIIIICIAAILLATPAVAKEDTYCMYEEIATIIHEYVPIAAGILRSLDVDLPDGLPMITAEIGGLLTDLRSASMGDDPDDAVKDVLFAYGLEKAAENLSDGDWVDIWTGISRVSPVMTAVFYRVNESGVPEGYLIRIAHYLMVRGDIQFDDGEIITTTALLNKLLATLPNATFTPAEEDIGMICLAEEIAAARNAMRGDLTPGEVHAIMPDVSMSKTTESN